MKPNKPLGYKNYGSIPHLSNSKLGSGDHHITIGQENILTIKKRDKHDLIYVFEKYDGSNVGIAKHNNKIYALSRKGYEAETSPYKIHLDFNKWVDERRDYFDKILNNGERLCAEWMSEPVGMIYEIKTDPIVFFDYFKDNTRQPIDDLYNKIYRFDIVRLLHKGDSITVNELMPILNKKTPEIKASENPEGMVYRVERKNKCDFLAKWVRNDFKTGQYLKRT